MTTSGSRLRAKASLAAAAAIVALMAGGAAWEIALRVRHEGRVERITGVVPWRVATWGGLTYHWDAYHPTLGWTNQPGYRSDAEVPFHVSINAQGLRATREYAPRPPAGTRRVAVFGDSFVFGEEVDDDETLPAWLERSLGGSEVLNFGVHGYGLGQTALRLIEDVLTFRPDHVVLVVLLPQDVARLAIDRFVHAKPAFAVREGRLVIENSPVPTQDAQPWILRRCFVAAHLFGRPVASVRPTDVRSHVEVVRAVLALVARRCEAAVSTLTVVPFAGPADIVRMESDPSLRATVDAMRRGFAGVGVDVLDLSDDLAAVLQRHRATFVAPRGHWSGNANRWLAARIAAHLEHVPPPPQERPG